MIQKMILIMIDIIQFQEINKNILLKLEKIKLWSALLKYFIYIFSEFEKFCLSFFCLNFEIEDAHGVYIFNNFL